MPDAKITNMTEAHLAGLLDLIEKFLAEQTALEPLMQTNENWRDTLEGFLKAVMRKPDYHVRVLEARGRAVGFLMCGMSVEPAYVKGRIGYIADCYVLPELRGHGLGAGLVRDAKKILAKMDADSIQLNVISGNAAAIGFWKKMGFETYMLRMKADVD